MMAGTDWLPKRPRTLKSQLALAGVALLAGLTAVTAYTITRNTRNAEPSAFAEAPVAVVGDQHPDTSQPDWSRPFRDEEASKPRYPQTINGFRLIPGDGDPSVSVCKPGEAKWADEGEADRSLLGISPSVLPAGAELDPALNQSVACGGRVIVVERFYVIPHETSLAVKLAGGASWFDLQHGGYIWVTRMAIKEPAWDGSDVPSEQWSAAVVNGLPAAFGKSIIDGLGHSSVVVWEPSSGELTAVRALDRPFAEVLAVAEGLTK